MAKNKKQNTIYTFFGKLGDIFLIPVFIIAIFVSTFILFQNKGDTVPSIFGVSIVKVLSGSMRNSGFEVDDRVFILKTNGKDLWGDENDGDIIAFFSYEDPADKSLEKTKLESKDQTIEITQSVSGRKSLKDLQGKNYRVIFHKIIGVYQDATGARYFKTKGTSNVTEDTNLIREDFVLGRYANTPKWIRNTLKWLAGSAGMITCVCIPLGIMVIFQALALIEQVNFIYVEKRLLRGNMHWQDYEAKRLIKTGDMEETCKIIYYTMVEEDEREELLPALWIFPDKLNKKQQEKKEIVLKGANILSTEGKEAYFNYWYNNLKWNWDKKKIEEELFQIHNQKLMTNLNNKNEEKEG